MAATSEQSIRSGSSFWRHPQRVWARRAFFQVHLWTGIALAIYCVLIGVSGSVLVFDNELGRLSYPEWLGNARVAPANPQLWVAAAQNIQRAEPEWQLGYLYGPGVRGSNFYGVLSRGGRYEYVFASSRDGHVLGKQSLERGWLNWTADLHYRLMGGRTGEVVNGIGAACLLLLCITGAVIWWPGVRSWKRALRVDFRRRWQRINFDLHSAVGFWTLAFMAMWAVSGVYFIWPGPFVAMVSRLSPVGNASAPQFKISAKGSSRVAMDAILGAAAREKPLTHLQAVGFPTETSPWTVMFAKGDARDFSHSTNIYFDPSSGARLGVWRVDGNRTAGDWLIWLMEPLHFGTYYGLFAKCVWAMTGLLLPVLAVTGVLMYWNRYLRKKIAGGGGRAGAAIGAVGDCREAKPQH